ncbi:GNAT family N-acetyltransferase [Marinilabilia sp.]|uniref:GNAT family N-acetyltransferase n=1 Tax=Marinilabilia sp. TaxID=2021252 RepID=UPI0025BA6DBF|nr:GNAT family N-acetyltransferase [Marinilabilia sp.]
MKVLSAEIEADYLEWLAIWEDWDGKEIFAHPDYLRLYSDNSRARCAVSKSDAGVLIYPFCLREISFDCNCAEVPKACYDIISPYGYGGYFFIGIGDFKELVLEFNAAFSQWAVSQEIVSEFVRFDLFGKGWKHYFGEVVHNNDNVVCDLTRGKQQIWLDYKQKVRNNVRKANNSGLQLQLDFAGDRVVEFMEIYYGTMDRRQAKRKYYFDRQFFDRIHKKLAGHFVYVYACLEGKILSADLVLISDYNLYSFLSATDGDSFGYRPNDFVKHNIICWGIEQSKLAYILGGGYNLSDSLFEYKKAFAPTGIFPFFIGKKIFNQELYDLLVRIRVSECQDDCGVVNQVPGFFPQYRGPSDESEYYW